MKTSIAVFVFLFFPIATTLAQWSQDPTVNTVLDKPGDQRAPLITTDGKGGAIVAWDEDNGVFANWIDNYGFRQWGSDGVRISPVGRIAALTNITSAGSGGAVIVWEDLTNARQVGDEVVRIIENEMFVQRVDSAGRLVWDADGVAIRTKIDTTTISAFGLVSSDFETFILFWTDDRRHVLTNSALDDFYAQKIDLEGRALWDNNGKLITVHGGLVNTRHRIVADDAGGILLARFGEGNGNTVVERISAEGELLWQAGGVSVHTGGAFEIASDERGGAVVSGRDFPGGGIIQTKVQRINDLGELLWGDSAKVVTESGDLNTFPRIVNDGNSGAIVYWDAIDTDGERKGLFQHIDSVGTIVGERTSVRFNFTSTIHPIVISDRHGGMILLANDFNTSKGDFWAVKTNFDRKLVWSEQGVLFRERPFDDWPFFFDVIDDGSGGFIAVWEEFKDNTFWDIVLQQVSVNGKLGDVITSLEENPTSAKPEEYTLSQNYPNPFNPETRIRFNLKHSGLVSLKIYDLSGKEVITLIERDLPLGEHQVTWNGQNASGKKSASGIYFYRLEVNDFRAVRKMIYLQ